MLVSAFYALIAVFSPHLRIVNQYYKKTIIYILQGLNQVSLCLRQHQKSLQGSPFILRPCKNLKETKTNKSNSKFHYCYI